MIRRLLKPIVDKKVMNIAPLEERAHIAYERKMFGVASFDNEGRVPEEVRNTPHFIGFANGFSKKCKRPKELGIPESERVDYWIGYWAGKKESELYKSN